MSKYFFICCVLIASLLTASHKASGQWINEAEKEEMYGMISNINSHSSFRNPAYRSAAMNKMIEEANYFANRLNLPTKRPIIVTDVQYPFIAAPWFSVIRESINGGAWPNTAFSNRIYDVSIPREERLRALKIGLHGTIETTNFFFSFDNGKLWEVMRLSEHQVEYYSHDLDKLIGKPSLIDTNGAYKLAMQWLAAVDVDVEALGKLKWTVNQLHYKAHGATNYVTLPLFYVDFGLKHYAASGNLKAFDEPLVSVEVLGTTKELQDLTIKDLSLSRRPLLLITNALDLVHTPNPPVKRLEGQANVP